VTTVAVLVLGATVVAAALLAGPFLRGRITAEARARGVELTFDGLGFWGWAVSLSGVHFQLVGLPGLDGRAGHVDVALGGWDPERVKATEVRVELLGSAADLALALGEWTARHPGAYRLPVSAEGLTLSWRPSATEPAWLTVDGGGMTTSASGVVFTAGHATASGVEVGSVSASWSAEAAAITMGFGAADPKLAPLQISVRHAATPPTATITLAPTDLAKLAGPVGVPLVAPGVVASGRVDLSFTRGLAAGPVTGAVEARLDGWVPPHPVELDGFIFGGATLFTSKLDVNADRSIVQLIQSRVRAGAFDLGGSGRIDRHSGYGTITMSFAGSLPCAAIAESAAAAHIGSFLAEMVGGAAKRFVDGQVSVRVKISADSRHLDAARVDPSVGVGCGLTPLRGLDPRLLQRIPQRLKDLADSLPALPDFPLP
jgi:hypothetical protein